MTFHPQHYRTPIPTGAPTSFPSSYYRIAYDISPLSTPPPSNRGSVRSLSSLSSGSSYSSAPTTLTFPSYNPSRTNSVSSSIISVTPNHFSGGVYNYNVKPPLSSVSSLSSASHSPPTTPKNSVQLPRIGFSTPALGLASHGLYLARSTAAEERANSLRTTHSGVGVSQAIDQTLAAQKAGYAKTSLTTNTGALIGSLFGPIGMAVGALTGFTAGKIAERNHTIEPLTAYDRTGPINPLK